MGEVAAGERVRSLTPGGLDGNQDCGLPTHVEVWVGSEEDERSYAVNDCDATFRELHRRTAVEEGMSPYVVELSATAIVYGDDRFFDMGDICSKLAQESASCGTDFVAPSLDVHSLVGPILSFGTQTGEAGAGGPPYHEERWTTVDLRSGSPAPLDAAVTEESLVEALKNDDYLQRTLDDEAKRTLASARSLADALEAWGAESMRERGEFGAYAFYEWDAAREKVAMRLAFREWTSGMSPNRVSQLGLWVTPDAEAKAWFEAAARGQGLLANTRR